MTNGEIVVIRKSRELVDKFRSIVVFRQVVRIAFNR